MSFPEDNGIIITISRYYVPEPSSLRLLAGGWAAFLGLRRKRASQRVHRLLGGDARLGSKPAVRSQSFAPRFAYLVVYDEHISARQQRTHFLAQGTNFGLRNDCIYAKLPRAIWLDLVHGE